LRLVLRLQDIYKRKQTSGKSSSDGTNEYL
jgi:hypothetical protein